MYVKFSAQGLSPTIPLSLSWGRADLKLSEELIAQLDQAPGTWKSENSTPCVTQVKMGGDKSWKKRGGGIPLSLSGDELILN